MTAHERENTTSLRAGVSKRVKQILLLVVFEAALLFFAAGHIDWLWAWVFLGLYCAGILLNGYFMFRYSPETIARRASSKGMRGWDKVVAGLWSLMGIVQMVIAGLDERYSLTTSLDPAAHGVGIVVFLLGYALFSWAMTSNAYFASVVRVQPELGHRVCTTGPYRYVRHPGYVGTMLQSAGLPLLLGSLYAFVPGLVAMLLMVLRTALEDRTLSAELPGYVEYVQHTHYRLLPGVW